MGDTSLPLVPLLKSAAKCPKCGSPPALRFGTALARALRPLAPSAIVATYQCHKPACAAVYPVTVGDVRAAAGRRGRAPGVARRKAG